ncbi:MAG: hypothetical protein ACTSQK_02240 [Candidatus Heimdallarchaeota archaeon]
MTKNRIVKGSIVMIITLLFMAMTISTSQLKATTVDESKVQLADAEYTGSQYLEEIDIYPLKDTAAGINVGFIGGTVELPFDVTTASYSNLEALNLIVANQAAWRMHSQRRFWDVADGASLMLVFRGLTTGESLTKGNEIAAMIETAYNFSLTLVFGRWDAGQEIAVLVYQGRIAYQSVFDAFTDDFTSYVSDDGFGEGITSSVLNNAPIKAMGVSLVKGRYVLMQPALGLVPVLECAWIDPDGLVRDGTIIDMSLLNIMPDLTEVSGASNALASVVRMDLPYVVDVLEIDPDTDNMYPHLKGNFEWVVKVDIPIWQRDLTFDDIFVSYDLNLSDMRSYPQVIGELSLNSSLPFNGGQDIEYLFTWENVGTETAYNITLSYGEFTGSDLNGTKLDVENPELEFNGTQVMYYDGNDGYVSSTLIVGPEVVTIEGWFKNKTTDQWLGDGEYYPGEGIDYLLSLAYSEQTFLQLDIGDFDDPNVTNAEDSFTLTTTIDELAPGENVTKSFAIRSLPSGPVSFYTNVTPTTTNYKIEVLETVNLEECFPLLLRMVGSSLHIPEDQVTWTNWFPQEVVGSAFIYNEADGTEYMGLTNGLVIQVYDDEAVLVGKVSLDKDVYTFGDDVTFTLELENIGNADATDVDYQFYHAFVTDDLELGYIREIPGSNGTIPLIEAGNTVSVNYTEAAITNVGLHPVFAVFGYTSDEPGTDPRDVPADLPWYLTEDMSEAAINILEALVYANPIFNTTRHNAVISSMDFGLVLPPPSKEGTTQPTYPTPEVEVTTELIGLTNDTEVGDELTLRTTITNVGDEPTNVIYMQRIPASLGFVADTDSVTVEGFEVSYDKAWINPPYFGMTMGIIAGDLTTPAGAIGVPLGVNETMIVEITVTIKTSGEVFIPPAEIRYNSAYNMTSRPGINDDSAVPENDTQASILNGLYAASISSDISVDLSINDIGDASDTVSTNSWGSYSDSLTFTIQSLGGIGYGFIYVGVGLIAVTGVAVLIYFRANGKKH